MRHAALLLSCLATAALPAAPDPRENLRESFIVQPTSPPADARPAGAGTARRSEAGARR